MIIVDRLEKRFGETPALRSVSFRIDKGEIVGLLGPNGAGKTTTIKILTGFLQPDAGSVHIDGLDVMTRTPQVQQRIGYLPESAPLYGGLSVQRYLQMMADLRQIPAAEQTERISDAVYATNLEDHLTRPIAQLSKGFRQRVGLAQAILHQPKLLILDEPTIGLDPTQILDIRRLIRRLATHTTILFSTHILSEVEALCDRAIMLLNGQVRADARLSELAQTGSATLVLQNDFNGQDTRALAEIQKTIAALPGVTHVERIQNASNPTETRSSGPHATADISSGPHATTNISGKLYPALRVIGQPDTDLCPLIYRAARQHDWPLRELRQDAQTLESVFNRLVVEQPGEAVTE